MEGRQTGSTTADNGKLLSPNEVRALDFKIIRYQREKERKSGKEREGERERGRERRHLKMCTLKRERRRTTAGLTTALLLARTTKSPAKRKKKLLFPAESETRGRKRRVPLF